MKVFGVILIIVAVVAFMMCISYGSTAFDKYAKGGQAISDEYIFRSYEEEAALKHVINSNHFIAFCVLSGCCGVAGMTALCFGGYMIVKGDGVGGGAFGEPGMGKLYDEKTGKWNT